MKSVSLIPHTILIVAVRSDWPGCVINTVMSIPLDHFGRGPSRIFRNSVMASDAAGFDLFTITATSSSAACETAPNPRSAIATSTTQARFIDSVLTQTPPGATFVDIQLEGRRTGNSVQYLQSRGSTLSN